MATQQSTAIKALRFQAEVKASLARIEAHLGIGAVIAAPAVEQVVPDVLTPEIAAEMNAKLTGVPNPAACKTSPKKG